MNAFNTKRDVKSIITDARDYALVEGIILRKAEIGNDNIVAQLPITLTPTYFPKRLYNSCLSVEQTVGKLLLAIANDSTFIEETLSPLSKVDEFTRNLLNINRTVQKEGLAQPIISCINRSDYMLDQYDDKNLRARQVEVNAIASAMSVPSLKVKNLHDFLRTKYNMPYSGCSFPKSEALEMVARSLIDAFDAYGRSDSILMNVVEDRSLNIGDHLGIELEVHRLRADIKIARRRFIDLPNLIKLGPNKELLLEDGKEVAVIYYRYGYDPSNYSFIEAWKTRLILEQSRAIKCPSINYHLSGVKKFQQVLCDQLKLERYLGTEEAEHLAQLYCKFWTLEDCYDEKGTINFPTFENIVLKPQREGGGHNIFGSKIKPFLETQVRPEDRSQYIIMEYINSPPTPNRLLTFEDDPKEDSVQIEDKLVSELGIFGSVLACGKATLSQRQAGYLVRSKKQGVKEGGVAAGYAGISSLALTDETYPKCCHE